MTGPVALALDGVTKHFGPAQGVRALQLRVSAGGVVALIGPSGCGKSTTLRLIAGLERPDEGSISLGGVVIADRRNSVPPERRRVGLVFQDHALFPHLSVSGNVAFGLSHLPRNLRRTRIGDTLELVRSGHLTDRYPHELSGGEQQRVALARALAPRPAVMLLDEPFAGLDESLRAQVRRDTVATLREAGTTTLLVTHQQAEALSVGHRVVVMRQGGIEQVDTPERVFDHPSSRFVASFMGDADFLPAQAHGGWLSCEIGVVPVAAGRVGHARGVEVVLRPHEVAIRSEPGSAARVTAVEYQGMRVCHHVTLASGRTVRSWTPPTTRHRVGTAVAVSVAPGAAPPLLITEEPGTCPPRPRTLGRGNRVQAPGPDVVGFR